MKAVRGVLLTLAILVGCLVAAFVIANLVDIVLPGALLQGRNVRRVALLASVLIFAATLLRRGMVEWPQVFIELAVVEIVIAGLIWRFSGVVAVDALFADWWLAINAHLVLPWLLALVVRAARARSRTPQSAS